jgi:hypothetical protein
MAISFVNGYLCTSCCDVAKAKRGENPHPKPGVDGKEIDPAKAGDPARARASGSEAVSFGGALAGNIDAAAVGPTQNPDPAQTTGNLVDRLA